MRNRSGVQIHGDGFRINHEQEGVGKLALQHEGHEWESFITGKFQERRKRASQHLAQYLGTI